MYTTILSGKVFVPRDFSESRVVRFASRFPVELEGKIDRQLFDNTNITHLCIEHYSCTEQV